MRLPLLLTILLPLAGAGFFSRVKSIFKCRSFSMDYKDDSTPCPSRCQFLYTQCLDESQLFSGCVCGAGSLFDHSMQRCITEAECSALEGADHRFIIDQVHNKRRGYNISCDFQNFCDLRKITKTVYWRGDQSSDVFYKGTTAADCAKVSEKKQLFAMSLRRIWEADYKDEMDY
ncbi:hypothetical protein PRIPAC_96992 [Pristionchus pacificus]|uniref:Uncharacterized protein n=1 Tax=Pristionchus pacificus TaxID=54126 RepID=A0A2A6CH36_PRIPA|nr:hypothetical protein PRIPAC_96992 [Pristionchus pacificus]|eukprot:PDM77449.1 hypothetical protein PRIPAC_33179 [Pristionchus pacificus]